MYGQYSRAVSNQERVIVALVRYVWKHNNFSTIGRGPKHSARGLFSSVARENMSCVTKRIVLHFRGEKRKIIPFVTYSPTGFLNITISIFCVIFQTCKVLISGHLSMYLNTMQCILYNLQIALFYRVFFATLKHILKRHYQCYSLENTYEILQSTNEKSK